MSSQTKESAFEEYVETILLNAAGWCSGDVSEWDVDRALFAPIVLSFIQNTQPKMWDQMRTLHGSGRPMRRGGLTWWRSCWAVTGGSCRSTICPERTCRR